MPPGIARKYRKACQAVAELGAGTPKRQKKLQKTAESNLRQARALTTKARKKKISNDCARAILDRLS